MAHAKSDRVVLLVGYSPGADNVGGIKAVREHGGLLLAGAKLTIEAVLANESQRLSVKGTERALKLVSALAKAGFLARLESEA